MIKALVIPVGEAGEVREIEPDAQTLQGIVGGWIEHIGTGESWHAYCDEEGKLKSRPSNRVATYTAWRLGWPTRDILVGDVVFLGTDPRDSAEEGDVPADVLPAWTWAIAASLDAEERDAGRPPQSQ